MTGWFEWKGEKSTDYGVIVSQHPPLTIPSERSTQTNVPGRPGSLTTLEGEDVYDDMILSTECFIQDISRISEIAAWLKGSDKVTFGNREGGFYYARIANQISFEKILRGNPHRSFTINFRCKPFWYEEDVVAITLTASGKFVNNPGSVYSEPVITVYGTGDITLMVDMEIISLTGIDGSITLDTPLMEAYSGVTPMNDHMSGEFPILRPGANAVSWIGEVSKVVISPNWRYLL